MHQVGLVCCITEFRSARRDRLQRGVVELIERLFRVSAVLDHFETPMKSETPAE
jgi:hypothetical protein